MKWSEIYSKCNNNENTIIESIKQPIQLVASFKKFLQKYGLPLTLVIIIFLVLIIITYKFNIQIILAYLAVVLFTLIALIYNNTYKIDIRGNQLKLYTPLNHLNIKYENLVTLFISREKKHVMLIPYYIYNINIIYIENKQKNFAAFTTIMLKPNDTLKFFKSITFKSIKTQEAK